MNWLKWLYQIAKVKYQIKRIDKRISSNQEGINLALDFELKENAIIDEFKPIVETAMKNIQVLLANRARFELFLANLEAKQVTSVGKYWTD